MGKFKEFQQHLEDDIAELLQTEEVIKHSDIDNSGLYVEQYPRQQALQLMSIRRQDIIIELLIGHLADRTKQQLSEQVLG